MEHGAWGRWYENGKRITSLFISIPLTWAVKIYIYEFFCAFRKRCQGLFRDVGILLTLVGFQ